jgi:hypothetical protein
MQWIFHTTPGTKPAETFVHLAATQPTSGFGEVFQYNNLMASAAGFLAAHILYSSMELAAGGSLHALADSGAATVFSMIWRSPPNRLMQDGDISPRSISGAHASCPRQRSKIASNNSIRMASVSSAVRSLSKMRLAWMLSYTTAHSQ